jgi:hypothetical protein
MQWRSAEHRNPLNAFWLECPDALHIMLAGWDQPSFVQNLCQKYTSNNDAHEPTGPMSFGFSITDIIKAAQIAKDIKDIWFTRLNRAGSYKVATVASAFH